MDVTILSIHLLPKQPDQFIVCSKSNTIAIMNMQGQVDYMFSNEFLLYILCKAEFFLS